MPQPIVIENPVLNTPYKEPTRHFRFTDEGITDEIVASRRRSSYFVPLPRPKKKGTQMSLYQTEQVRIQKEQADKIAQKVSEGKIKIETGVRKLGEIAVPEKEVATDAGLVQFRETKVLKIVDIKLVPDKYFVIDEAEVMSDLKQGIDVPGCEIDIIQTPINYR